MATILSISESELKAARKAGFKRKKPKKPKSKTLSSIEGFIDRYNNWVKAAKEKTAAAKKKNDDKAKAKSLAAKIRNL